MTTPNDSPQFKSMDEAWEYIQSQEPLPSVAANTDFNQGVERGKYIERTRIIKLLEADAGKCIQTMPSNEHLDDWCNCRLIALIKGEN